MTKRYWFHCEYRMVKMTNTDLTAMPLPWIEITKEMYLDFIS